MIEIIPSEWMREYLKDRREFTDAEKATMIWNSPIATWKEKLDSLEELSMVSSDANLNAQITDRIVYEKRAYYEAKHRFEDETKDIISRYWKRTNIELEKQHIAIIREEYQGRI